MIFFSVSENKAFVLFCQLFIMVKCLDFSDGTQRDRHGNRNCNKKLLRVLTLSQKSSTLL